MADETASKMYESARERLKELLRQETEIKEQISHWGPIVEQLARLTGETIDLDISSRTNELRQNQESSAGAGQEMGLTEAIRWVFRQPLILPLTPTQVRDRMAEMGYDLSKYKHEMPPIHNTLKRMKEAGEIKEVEAVGGFGGKAFVSAR
jgi:dihydroorotate dehydrogenase